MSISSNTSGQLTVPYRGTAHNTPCSFSCWAKLLANNGTNFGSVLTMEDSYFNTYPYIGRNGTGNGVVYSPGSLGNFQIVADGTKWFFCAATFDGTGGPSTGIGLDSKGVWVVQTTASSSNGGSGLPSILIGGQQISSGVSTNADNVAYRGVHIWTEAKTIAFLKAQASQLAPVEENNLFSTTWPYDKTLSNLGHSNVGHPWSVFAGTWTQTTDEPPVPEVINKRAWAFAPRQQGGISVPFWAA